MAPAARSPRGDLAPFGLEHEPTVGESLAAGADVVLAPLNLCVETLDGVRNHSWSRPMPATPEGEIVSWADRIAYVCHDWEDAVAAGIVTTAMLPDIVRERCGATRSDQLDAFVRALVEGTANAGAVAMVEPVAEALAAFRQVNYERIYLRPASVAQSAGAGASAGVRPSSRAIVTHSERSDWRTNMTTAPAPPCTRPDITLRLTTSIGGPASSLITTSPWSGCSSIACSKGVPSTRST